MCVQMAFPWGDEVAIETPSGLRLDTRPYRERCPAWLIPRKEYLVTGADGGTRREYELAWQPESGR